ncbi:HelD family protein [Naumannella halotolerans]|uniref:HelD family protein n=1 Tax=Naumannella halotolerans TaxID=993414 RepID=UPI00370D318E
MERELASEQAHVDKVYDRLSAAARSARQVATEGQALYRTDRNNFVRDEDGTGMYERDVFAFQAAKRLATLDAEHEGLVFGRLDRTDGEIRYIGRIGVRDADYEPLVIDWRARAAEPFYRATPADPMEVIRRRVLRSRGEKVIGIEDDLLDTDSDTDLVVLGEGALMAALSRARGSQMKDIVATIQAEQDEAIRAPYSGATIISGGPGTGKTVVALHRAAYLLYSNRRRFESGGVLVVGPSQVFMNYIERVLPSLGEDAVTLRSIGAVAVDSLGFSASVTDPPQVHRIKGSLRMVPVLRSLLDSADPNATEPPRLRVSVKGEVLILGAEELTRIRRQILRQRRYNQSLREAESALLETLWRRWSALDRGPEAAELEREAFDDLVTSSSAYRDFIARWWPPLSAMQVLRRLADPARAALAGRDRLSTAEIELLSAVYAAETAWTIDDIALLDELTTILGPVPEAEPDEDNAVSFSDTRQTELVTTADRLSRNREIDPNADTHDSFAHILLDEAQDITPMQWRMLRRRGGGASWTIVGDPAQSSWPDRAETDQAINELIGRGPSRRFRMSTNYRSPAEVFELAAKVVRSDVPDADLPDAVRRTGVAPTLLATTGAELVPTLLDVITDLTAQVEGTIGVIAPPSRLTQLRTALDGSVGRELGRRLVVVSPLEAKGLEYDAAVVVAPDEIVAESPGGIRVLYVALTRPTQRLVTIDVDSPGRWRPARSEPGPA